MIYQTDGTAGFYFYNGTTWVSLSSGSSGGTGTVTNVTGTSPLTVTNSSTTPNISISQANGTTNGFLSNTDWSIFNNKFTLPSLTSGSLLFSNGTTITQNNNNLFWNNTNNNLGIGTNSPNASSILDLNSTSKGFLAPRMTKSQREAIASPTAGLMVYQTDEIPGHFHYQNGAWTRLINGTITTNFTNNGQAETVQEFNYTGSVQTFTVPTGVSVLKIEANGAAGGDGVMHQPNVAIEYPAGGLGGSVTGYFNVTAGQVLNIYVGGKPTTPTTLSSNGQYIGGGYNGGGDSRAELSGGTYFIPGGGGGASDVRAGGTDLSNRIIVGGGGAGSLKRTFGGTNYTGGNGGGLSGTNGACLNGGCGNGATQSTGAALGQGGQAIALNAGGGGGGYYGGNAGTAVDATGGGGSGFVANSIVTPTYIVGNNGGNGRVVITYGAFQLDTLTTLPYKLASASLYQQKYTDKGILFSTGTNQTVDASNFNWNNTSKRLGVGSSTSRSRMSVDANTSDWVASDFGIANSERVVLGVRSGKATIGAHTNALNGWTSLLINPEGGNVGIGTLNPTSKLHVVGDALFENNLSINQKIMMGASVSSGALFEMNSTTGTLLVPRMNTAQQNAIPQATNGMVLYNNQLNKPMFYTGGAWQDVLLNDQSANPSITANFYFTGNMQTFTVPAGVTSLEITAKGASGGNAFGTLSGSVFPYRGFGGTVTTTLSVTPGQVLTIFVGGTPLSYYDGGYNGGGNAPAATVGNIYRGGGGGASDIRIGGTTLANRVVVAGGGGGANYSTGSTGLCGGGLTACGNSTVGYAGQNQAGLGGTLGIGASCAGTAQFNSWGGGGGGGYYGGGAYCDYSEQGISSGGGSSYTDATLCTNVVHTQGNNDGHGTISIRYAVASRQNPYLDGGNFSNIPATAIVGGNLTQQGNTFNGNSQLVQTNASGQLPALNASNLTNITPANISSGTLPALNGSNLTNITPANISSGTLPTLNGSNLTNLNPANFASGTLNALNGSNLTALNASNISAGTLADARLTSNVTLLGNTFNGNNQLVQLNGTGLLPALNGSNLTALNATNISAGTLADARLTTNVTLLGNTFNGNNQLVKLNGTGLLPALDGSNLTNLTINNLSGTVPTTKGGTGTNTSFTQGSMVFAGVSGNYTQNNAQLFWDNTTNRLGIGTNTPEASLHINGTLKIQTGTPAAGKVLTSDANGVATWTNPSRTRSIFYDPNMITNSVNPVSGGGIAIVNVSGSASNKPSVQFSDNNQAGINLNFPVPSDWNGTSNFTVKLYSTHQSTTSGDFYFEYATSYVNDGATIDASGASGSFLVSVNNGDEYKQKVTSLTLIPTAGTSMIQLKFIRYGSHTNDTASGNFNLLGVKIEYMD
jgi:hypothetical protein